MCIGHLEKSKVAREARASEGEWLVGSHGKVWPSGDVGRSPSSKEHSLNF